jgi:hypothetical protein
VLPFAVVAVVVVAVDCAYAAVVAAGGCIARNAPRITPIVTTIVEYLAAAAAIIANFTNA